MSKTFQKKVEDFRCEHCGKIVNGSGYPNHCPDCLWSKHVDIHPGDRASSCKGMMQPISVSQKSGEWVIRHKCLLCGHEKNNKAAKDDDMRRIIELSTIQEPDSLRLNQ